MDVAFYLSGAAWIAYLVLRWQPVDSSGTYFMCTAQFRCDHWWNDSTVK
jgi:hypothetical protein